MRFVCFHLQYFVQICTSIVPQKYVHLENTELLISVSANRLHKTSQNKESPLKHYKTKF